MRNYDNPLTNVIRTIHRDKKTSLVKFSINILFRVSPHLTYHTLSSLEAELINLPRHHTRIYIHKYSKSYSTHS